MAASVTCILHMLNLDAKELHPTTDITILEIIHFVDMALVAYSSCDNP